MNTQKIERWHKKANEIADKVHCMLVETFGGDNRINYCVEVDRWDDYVRVLVYVAVDYKFPDLREAVGSRCNTLIYSDYYSDYDEEEFLENVRKMIIDFADEVEAATKQPNY